MPAELTVILKCDGCNCTASIAATATFVVGLGGTNLQVDLSNRWLMFGETFGRKFLCACPEHTEEVRDFLFKYADNKPSK